jgi:hypothetical protein
VGDAIQNDMTGASGTPLISSPAMIGITVQEQNGLKAPTAVAKRTASPSRPANAFRMASVRSNILIVTLRNMLSKKKGSTFQEALPTKRIISTRSFITVLLYRNITIYLGNKKSLSKKRSFT